jgi:hypothetical protein
VSGDDERLEEARVVFSVVEVEIEDGVEDDDVEDQRWTK